jgi:hypothetical protein
MMEAPSGPAGDEIPSDLDDATWRRYTGLQELVGREKDHG